MKEFAIRTRPWNFLNEGNLWTILLEFNTLSYNVYLVLKLKVYKPIIFFLFLFMFCFWMDLKFFNFLFNFFMKEQLLIEENIYILQLYYFFFEKKMLILYIIILLFILFIFWIKKFNIKETIKFILIFSYHRINFIINLIILEKILNINMQEFFEYNFIIMVIFIIYIIIFWIYFIIKKEPLNYKLLHFLNIPFLPMLIWIIIFFFNDKLFFLLKYNLKEFDYKYYDSYFHIIDETALNIDIINIDEKN